MGLAFEFTAPIWYWRGPAPWYYVTIPESHSHDLKAISTMVTYGWGVIPVQVRVGGTAWQTSLFPKEGRYLVPIKAAVRQAEHLELDDEITVRIEVQI